MDHLHAVNKGRLAKWRRQGTVTRVERPTNIRRAHVLGYKAKQGVVVVRVRVDKGMRKRPKVWGGRRPKRFGKYFSLAKSKQWVAEEKAATKYPNMEVLNSYLAGGDGTKNWYEVILVDRSHPSILKDKELRRIASQRGRAFRGLTSAGKKSRG